MSWASKNKNHEEHHSAKREQYFIEKMQNWNDFVQSTDEVIK